MTSVLEAVERLGKTTEQLTGEIVDRLERLEAQGERPMATAASKAESEYSKAFFDWIRAPGSATAKQRLESVAHERKDVLIGTPLAGGNALPLHISDRIEARVKQLNPFRKLCRVDKSFSQNYRILLDQNNASAGWTSETGTRSATTTPNLEDRSPTTGELYAYPVASNWSLQDINFDVQTWLVNAVADEFSAAEATAFVTGNGTNQPTGFLNSTPVTTTDTASPQRAAGTLQYVSLSGATSPVAVNYISLTNLISQFAERYLEGDRVAWVMHRTTLAAVRNMRDTTGQPLWQPSLQAGVPGNLLGYPVYTTSAMPTYANDAFAVAFGNWERGYVIADRSELEITVENVTTPGFTKFYVRKRVGGCILNGQALKILRIAD